jgi:hypothetical protein
MVLGVVLSECLSRRVEAAGVNLTPGPGRVSPASFAGRMGGLSGLTVTLRSGYAL